MRRHYTEELLHISGYINGYLFTSNVEEEVLFSPKNKINSEILLKLGHELCRKSPNVYYYKIKRASV